MNFLKWRIFARFKDLHLLAFQYYSKQNECKHLQIEKFSMKTHFCLQLIYYSVFQFQFSSLVWWVLFNHFLSMFQLNLKHKVNTLHRSLIEQMDNSRLSTNRALLYKMEPKYLAHKIYFDFFRCGKWKSELFFWILFFLSHSFIDTILIDVTGT